MIAKQARMHGDGLWLIVTLLGERLDHCTTLIANLGLESRLAELL